MEVSAYTFQVSQSLFGHKKGDTGSIRSTQEYIYPPDVFKDLKLSQTIFFAKKPTHFGEPEVSFLDIPELKKEKKSGDS